jgi:hypothetical protein
MINVSHKKYSIRTILFLVVVRLHMPNASYSKVVPLLLNGQIGHFSRPDGWLGNFFLLLLIVVLFCSIIVHKNDSRVRVLQVGVSALEFMLLTSA